MNHWNIKYIFNISSELYKIKVKVPRSFLFAKLASLYVWCFPIPTNTLIFTTCLSQIQKATLSPKLRLQPWQNHVPQVNVYNSRHWWFSQNMLFSREPRGMVGFVFYLWKVPRDKKSRLNGWFYQVTAFSDRANPFCNSLQNLLRSSELQRVPKTTIDLKNWYNLVILEIGWNWIQGWHRQANQVLSLRVTRSSNLKVKESFRCFSHQKSSW